MYIIFYFAIYNNNRIKEYEKVHKYPPIRLLQINKKV